MLGLLGLNTPLGVCVGHASESDQVSVNVHPTWSGSQIPMSGGINDLQGYLVVCFNWGELSQISRAKEPQANRTSRI